MAMSAMMEPHPIAKLFPPIEGRDLEELRADIESRGMINAITIYEGMVLDGWHRYQIAMAIGKAVKSEPLPAGADPIQWAMSKNLRRRHLTSSQRALIAAQIADHRNQGRPGEGEKTLAASADELNVGERTAARARKVLDNAEPEVTHQVRTGRASLNDAESIADETPTAQRQAARRVEGGEAPTLRDAIEQIKSDPSAPTDPKPKRNANAKPKAKANGAGAPSPASPPPEPLPVPSLARIARARAVLGTIGVDAASSARVNTTVAAKRFCAPDDNPHPEDTTVWLRTEGVDEDTAETGVERLLDALEGGGAPSAVLIETEAPTHTRLMQRLLGACRRVALPEEAGASTAVLLGADADTKAFADAFGSTAVVLAPVGEGTAP